MLKRYSIPEIMPEKTLKDKVDEVAADDVELCLNRLLMLAKERAAAVSAVSILRFEFKKRDKALTALEESNERLWVFIRRIEDRFDEHDLWRDNKDLLEAYEELRKEAASDGE